MKTPRCDNARAWGFKPKFWPQCEDNKAKWMVEIPAIGDDMVLCEDCLDALKLDAKQCGYEVKVGRRIW